MDHHDHTDIALALAALAVCESLIVSLVEKGVLSSEEFEEILETARDSHANADPANYTTADHKKAADILRAMQTRSNGVRGSARL